MSIYIPMEIPKEPGPHKIRLFVREDGTASVWGLEEYIPHEPLDVIPVPDLSDKYISVAAAKAAMTARFKEDVDSYGVEIPECFDNDTANEILDKIPAADVRPVRHGRWQITDAYPHNVYCSECHKRFAQTHWAVWEDGSLPRAYCPTCGAKMDGGDA